MDAEPSIRPLEPQADCFVAACTGTDRLSTDLARPVVLVGVSADVDETLKSLNAEGHGSVALWPDGFVPWKRHEGWDDWRLLALAPAAPLDLTPLGASIDGGVIRLRLPRGVAAADVDRALRASLIGRRLQDVAICPRWLEGRSEARACTLLRPRYTLPLGAEVRGARLVTDIVVLDPRAEARRLAWLAVGACLAASSLPSPCWP